MGDVVCTGLFTVAPDLDAPPQSWLWLQTVNHRKSFWEDLDQTVIYCKRSYVRKTTAAVTNTGLTGRNESPFGCNFPADGVSWRSQRGAHREREQRVIAC